MKNIIINAFTDYINMLDADDVYIRLKYIASFNDKFSIYGKAYISHIIKIVKSVNPTIGDIQQEIINVANDILLNRISLDVKELI